MCPVLSTRRRSSPGKAMERPPRGDKELGVGKRVQAHYSNRWEKHYVQRE